MASEKTATDCLSANTAKTLPRHDKHVDETDMSDGGT